MPEHHQNWVRVSRSAPCPICGKPDNCEVSRDGGVVWCGRVDEGALRQNAGGQFLHRLGDDRSFVPVVRPSHPTKRLKRAPTKDWPAIAGRLAHNADEARAELAAQLGVSAAALDDLNVGWDPRQRFWSFPERDGDGQIIGINARHADGSKKRLYGGQSGLTYADRWDTGLGPILLVEGGSDTAALMTIGLSVVGRPSNTAGVKLLIDLLCDAAIDREIIVIGERDEKADGRWPGRDGAISTAKQLAEELGRTVAWSLCPDGAKDARGWMGSMPRLPKARMAALFVSGLETETVDPPVTLPTAPPQGPAVAIESWRDGMLQARIRSLSRPGYYLDASATGAGKTHVD